MSHVRCKYILWTIKCILFCICSDVILRVWKRIQQNTFTRWANEHLKTVHQSVLNLETDLDDGLKLISLLQVLSGKILPKHTKKPNFRSQKLENVSVALNFLEKDEGIKIVNIGKLFTY